MEKQILKRISSNEMKIVDIYKKVNFITPQNISYESFYNKMVSGNLVPGATYRIPYRAVNFLNGVSNAQEEPSTQTVTSGDVDGEFLTKLYNTGWPYSGGIDNIYVDPNSDYVYVSNYRYTMKLTKTGELDKSFTNGGLIGFINPRLKPSAVQNNKLLAYAGKNNEGTIDNTFYFSDGNLFRNTTFTENDGEPWQASSFEQPTSRPYYVKDTVVFKFNEDGTPNSEFLDNAIGVPDGDIYTLTTFGPQKDKILVGGSFNVIGGNVEFPNDGNGIIGFTYNNVTFEPGNDGVYSYSYDSTTSLSGDGCIFKFYVKNNVIEWFQISNVGQGFEVADVLTIDAGSVGNNIQPINITVTKVRPLYNYPYLVALNSDGTIYQEFMDNLAVEPPGDTVRACVVDDSGDIVIAGNGGIFAKYSVTGVFDVTFDTNTGTKFDDEVNTIVQVKEESSEYYGNYIVGGIFSEYNGDSVGYIAMINTDGTFNSDWLSATGTQFNDIVETITDNYCVKGLFTEFDGNSYNNVIKLNVSSVTNSTSIDYRLKPDRLKAIAGEAGNTEHVFMVGSNDLMGGPDKSTRGPLNIRDTMYISKVFISEIDDPYWSENSIYTSNFVEHIHVKALTNYITELSAYSEEYPLHKIDFIPWRNKVTGNLNNSFSWNGNGNGDDELYWGFDGTNPYIEILTDDKIIFGGSLRIDLSGDFEMDHEIDVTVASVPPGPFYQQNAYDMEMPDLYPQMIVSPDGKRLTFLNWGNNEWIKMRNIYLSISFAFGDAYGLITRRVDPVANVDIPADFIGNRYRRYFVSGEDLENNNFNSGGADCNNLFLGVANMNYGTNHVYVPTTYFLDLPIIPYNQQGEYGSIIIKGSGGFKQNNSMSGGYSMPQFDNVIFMDDPSHIYITTGFLANSTFSDCEALNITCRRIEFLTAHSSSPLSLNSSFISGILLYQLYECKLNDNLYSSNNSCCPPPIVSYYGLQNVEQTNSSSFGASNIIIDSTSFIGSLSYPLSSTYKRMLFDTTNNEWIVEYYDSGSINYSPAI